MAQIPTGRLVKGPKINQYVGMISHLLFNYCIYTNLYIYIAFMDMRVFGGNVR